jgi:membrane protein DedA with SNARE-associated domain
MLAVAPLAVHVHHHFHGYAPGYIGLGAAAMVSWAGIPGAGEAALVAAAVVATHGRLDIAEVLIVAWVGAMAGGVVGWLIGLRGGRALFARPGPLYRTRLRTLKRGERFYERYGLLAVYLTPTWMAGVARMRSTRFLLANAVTALVWAVTIGAGAYFAGPPIVDLVQGIGIAGLAIVVGVVVAGATVEAIRRRRRRR